MKRLALVGLVLGLIFGALLYGRNDAEPTTAQGNPSWRAFVPNLRSDPVTVVTPVATATPEVGAYVVFHGTYSLQAAGGVGVLELSVSGRAPIMNSTFTELIGTVEHGTPSVTTPCGPGNAQIDGTSPLKTYQLILPDEGLGAASVIIEPPTARWHVTLNCPDFPAAIVVHQDTFANFYVIHEHALNAAGGYLLTGIDPVPGHECIVWYRHSSEEVVVDDGSVREELTLAVVDSPNCEVPPGDDLPPLPNP